MYVKIVRKMKKIRTASIIEAIFKVYVKLTTNMIRFINAYLIFENFNINNVQY